MVKLEKAQQRRFLVLLTVTVLVIQIPFGLVAGDGPAPAASRGSRSTITTFDGGALDKTYQYDSSNVVRTAYFMLPNNAYVDQAELLVRPLPRQTGNKAYPDAPEVDVGDDGELEWSFKYQGSGMFGYQTEFWNDTIMNPVDLKANIKDNTTSIRLPVKANITTASLNIEGMFKFQQKFSFEGTVAGEYLGRDVSFVGDLNGDTWPDFAVGLPRNDTGGFTDNGRVLVFFGGAALDSTPDLILNGTKTGGEFGFHVAPAGDVNNDGKDDLLVDAPFYDGVGGTKAGRLYIYLGGSPMDDVADAIMDGEGVGDWFGICAVGAGDLNNDGYDDVVSSSPNWRETVDPYNIHGKIYIYYGGAPMDNIADLIIQGPTIGEYWGKALAMPGDLNNDGYDDLVIGTASNAVMCNGCGRVDILYGGSPMNSGIDLTMFGTGGENLGFSLDGVGDLNKDGYDDIIVGAIMNAAHGLGTGAAYIYLGGSPMNNVADLKIHGTGGGDYFGCSVSRVGDLNKDGWLDFAVGAEQNTTGPANIGAVFIFFGGSVLDNKSDLKLTKGGSNDLFGNSISGGTDLDKDTYPDLMIGAYQNDSKANDGGKAYLFLSIPKRAIDPVLEIEGMSGNEGRIWNATGVFIGNTTVPDFAKALNKYLSTAMATGSDQYGNQYVDVRLSVKGPSDAEFIISNLSIVYDYNAQISVKPNGGSLQQTLDDMVPHKDSGSTKVVLWAKSNSAGKLFFNGLRVVTDDGPSCAKIPDMSINEDTWSPRLFDLYTYFGDDNDPDDYLNYSVVSFTNTTYVNVTLNDTHYLSFDSLSGVKNDNWTGKTQVQLKGTDSRNLSKLSNKFNVTIAAVNDPPAFTTKPTLEAIASKPYSYQAKAIDAEGDTITFSLENPPAGMSVDSAKGTVTWTPAALGDFEVHLKASDGKDPGYQNYTIKVLPPNEAPVITSSPLGQAKVGYTYYYKVVATDKDGDKLTARLITGPAGMSFDNASWLVEFTPNISQVADHTVTVQVSDGRAVVNQTFKLIVISQGMNNVPAFTSSPPVLARVGWAYVYNITAFDADKDKLTYTLEKAPAGLAIRSSAGDSADWTPTENQIGSHEVVIKVTDGKAYALQKFSINVTMRGVNRPPVITSTPPLKAEVGFTYQYQVTASDDELDIITFSVDTPKLRMQLDPDTGLLIWHPSSTETGNQTIIVKASDGKGFGAQTFVVFVEEGSLNGLPRFLSTPETEAKVGVLYSYASNAVDPDSGDTVTYSLAQKPTMMTVVLTTGHVTWTPQTGQEGNWTIELRASDGKGFGVQRFVVNVQPGELVQVISVIITSPTSGSTVSKNLTAEGTAGVVIGKLYEVQVKLDENSWDSAQGLENWSYFIDTTTLKNGKHRLSVRAWDGTTYSNPVIVEFTVENKNQPKPEPDPPTLFGLSAGLCLVGIIVLIVVIVGIILVFKKSSAPPPVRRPPPQPYDRRPGDDRYPPRDRRGPPPREIGRYDRDDYRSEGQDQAYNDGFGQDYDQGYDDHHDQGYDQNYDQGPEDQGPYDGQDDYNDEGYDQGVDPGYRRR